MTHPAVAQSGIFSNISQLWNHNQFWEMMGPNSQTMPTLRPRSKTVWVELTISNPQFFSAAGAGQFKVPVGRGWSKTWQPEVTKTENSINPVLWPNGTAQRYCGNIPITRLSQRA
jgi:Fe-Mn family superoxide dismutase